MGSPCLVGRSHGRRLHDARRFAPLLSGFRADEDIVNGRDGHLVAGLARVELEDAALNAERTGSVPFDVAQPDDVANVGVGSGGRGRCRSLCGRKAHRTQGNNQNGRQFHKTISACLASGDVNKATTCKRGVRVNSTTVISMAHLMTQGMRGDV